MPKLFHRLPCIFFAFVFCFGCSSARLKLTSLDPVNIDPPRPQIMEIQSSEAVWWQDDKQRIHLAVQWRTGPLAALPLVGTGVQRFILAYRSEQPFHGLAANLRVDPKSLTMILTAPGQENYFSSVYGVIGVQRQGDRLTGSLRVWVGQQLYDFILGGWTRPAPYLVLGEFTALLNPGRAVALTDELGGEPPAPATMPASFPATRPATQPATQPR